MPVWIVLCAVNVCFTAQVDSRGRGGGSNSVGGRFVALMVVCETEERENVVCGKTDRKGERVQGCGGCKSRRK